MKNLLHSIQSDSHHFLVSPDNHLQRLDLFLQQVLPEYSRSFFQKLIEDGHVTCNNQVVSKPSHKLKQGDSIICSIPRIDFARSAAAIAPELVQDLAVQVVAQEPDFLIINKPAGLVVHKPAHTSTQVTLVDWLMASYPTLQAVGETERPGIVHRLDMQTSGLMIIPRTIAAHATFTHMFKERLIKKTYLAIVQGHPPAQATIDYAISRHPTERTKMTHSRSHGRAASTDFQVIDYFKDAALVKAFPKTGRTHQIRVHCAAWGHPIIGDTVYGKKSPLIARQALHAAELDFEYNNKKYHFEADLPEDMKMAIDILRK